MQTACLQCVNFIAREGKLTLASADGFRLAVTSLDYDDGEGQALVNGDELKGMPNALKRAKRAMVSFEPSGKSLFNYVPVGFQKVRLLKGSKMEIDSQVPRMYYW